MVCVPDLIFGWVLVGARRDPELSVAAIKRRAVDATEAQRLAAASAHRPRGHRASTPATGSAWPDHVRMQRLTGRGSSAWINIPLITSKL